MRARAIGEAFFLLGALAALSSCADDYHRYDHAAAPQSSSSSPSPAPWAAPGYSGERHIYYPAPAPVVRSSR